ncbi:MAG: arginine--tRNA ligase [Deltaproteobacteria bacterium]|nr:arginine--tRNA ligase [Deltaproteobacteria bacterium]MCL5276957.1 arginine--tRNA ligase [Deltaproteobacteria bacterium]
MIDKLIDLISGAVKDYTGAESVPPFTIAVSAGESHGDFSTGVAFNLAGALQQAPYDIASEIAQRLRPHTDLIDRIDVARPGHINFFMSDAFWQRGLRYILERQSDYGKNDTGRGKSALIEFVSANPTGPIHVGHGRGAVIGDVLSRIMAASGYSVTREYYVNDAGNQVLSLGYSVLNEYYRINDIDRTASMPGEYQGRYIHSISRTLDAVLPPAEINEENIRSITEFSVKSILGDERRALPDSNIKQVLQKFNIAFDTWFSEKRLYMDGSISGVIGELEKRRAVKYDDGATWFLSTLYGDEKDRVLRKQSGEFTYFASDIAYHVDKYRRGYDVLINIWGADHHGYLPRLRAALRALGYDADRLAVMFVQMVRLMRGDRPVAMSKRAGEYVTLEELIDEVGTDAVRFFFLQRSHGSQLVFDIDLAKRQSQENPVYYVQYAHARIASIFGYALTKGWDIDKVDLQTGYAFHNQEKRLLAHCLIYPEVIKDIVVKREPHRLPYYLMELVGVLHRYYTDTRVVGDDRTTGQRLLLMKMVKIVLKNALDMLGIGAPEKM